MTATQDKNAIRDVDQAYDLIASLLTRMETDLPRNSKTPCYLANPADEKLLGHLLEAKQSLMLAKSLFGLQLTASTFGNS